MAEKLDKVSETLESNLNQNSQLQSDMTYLKKELQEKEQREQ